ncbi:MAG: hypothetical protein K2X99_02635 [Gemmatimonadaceae bacterium]|nr:hypothetical protein [Gemmatimonadaceae bacterium]
MMRVVILSVVLATGVGAQPVVSRAERAASVALTAALDTDRHLSGGVARAANRAADLDGAIRSILKADPSLAAGSQGKSDQSLARRAASDVLACDRDDETWKKCDVRGVLAYAQVRSVERTKGGGLILSISIWHAGSPTGERYHFTVKLVPTGKDWKLDGPVTVIAG